MRMLARKSLLHSTVHSLKNLNQLNYMVCKWSNLQLNTSIFAKKRQMKEQIKRL